MVSWLGHRVTLAASGWLAAIGLGLAVLALVWSPVHVGRGWDLAVHVFDLLVFVAAASMVDVVTSPFFASFAFIVVSASRPGFEVSRPS